MAPTGQGPVQPLPRGDFNGRMLLVVTTLLVAFGTVAVASASEGQATANGGLAWSIMVHDLVYLGFGVVALYCVARIRLDWLIRRAPALVIVGLGLLLAVRAVGTSADGGKRWLDLHFIDLQPSELFKLCTVLFIGWLVAYHRDELGRARTLAVLTLPIVIGGALIVVEPDIGTASVVLAIAFVMLAVVGLRPGLLLSIAALGGVGFGAYMLAEPYSARRFFSFLHPDQNLLGSGYQLFQSKIGLGAGGLAGLGLGHSREKWGLLPNPHTDFIFTIIGEELGLVGTLTVLALFVWLLLVAMRIAARSHNESYRVVAVGIATWLTLEAVINVASVVGGWAVTGIPLPFFSYGGTALITELAAVGLLYNIAHDSTPSTPVARARAHRPGEAARRASVPSRAHHGERDTRRVR